MDPMDYINYARTAAALALVLGLILLIAWVARRFGLEKKISGIGRSSSRMKIEEVLYLDNRRKLVLVKKDEQELLLLLGAQNEQVVESCSATSRSPAA